jgi:hypothetical protein
MSNITRKRRSNGGTVLVEGVAGLLILILASFALIAFMVNSGIAIYYKSRLGFVTDRAAWFVARHYRSWDMSYSRSLSESSLLSLATPYINGLLASQGLPQARSITITTDSAPRMVFVSVELESVNLGSFGTLFGNLHLPSSIPLNDKAAALIIINEPPSIAVIAPDNGTFPQDYAPIPFTEIRVLLPDYGDTTRVNSATFQGGPYSTFSLSTATLAAANSVEPGSVIGF